MPFKVTASWRLKLLPERLDLETGQMAMSTGRRQFIRARRCGSLAARSRRAAAGADAAYRRAQTTRPDDPVGQARLRAYTGLQEVG